ncbi:hypothetical protein FR932_12085 [Moritella marina ATCC 15381]|uniref:Lipoprotein n=1 Tax=Moritella marina ATCC 15381 TaxID=1202962 RepID=A0A5J6WNR6_MORMI|nr:hypothetical protein [Moritella marina]QFI38535.1 hypothetical protein FR932_12085 [Moritella marina ATCC 15381]
MKKILITALFSVASLSLVGCSTVASLFQERDNTAELAIVTTDITTKALSDTTYFPSDIVEPLIDQSFATMAREYKMYATYFNICQKAPDDAVCEAPYKTAMTRYKQTKANHDVLSLLWTSDLKDIEIPPAAMNELGELLVKLDYLPVNKDLENNKELEKNKDLENSKAQEGSKGLNSNQSGKFTVEEISQATYHWMQDKGLPKTENILLLHEVLIKSEALKLTI